MKKLLKLLNQPHPLERDTKRIIKVAFGFGLFIFLFVLIFRPDQSGVAESPYFIWILIGSGLITFFTIVIIRLFIPFLFPKLFDEKNWKIKKEICFVSFIICSSVV